MKIDKYYIKSNQDVIAPFGVASRDIYLDGLAFGARLDLQTKEIFNEVVSIFINDVGAKRNVGRVMIGANLFMTSELVKSLKKFYRRWSADQELGSFQVVVQKSSAIALAKISPQACKDEIIKLPIYSIRKNHEVCDVKPLNLSLHKFITIDANLPSSIYGQEMESLGISFQPVSGMEINHWEHILMAAHLLAKEFCLQQFSWMSKFLPKKMMNYFGLSSFWSSKSNKIGKNCKIHPTAILEGCVIGDNVEIGPYCYLRACKIGRNTWVREHSSLELSFIENDCCLMTTDFFNTYVGARSVIFSPIIHNTLIAHDSFIGGGSGFSDFQFGKTSVKSNGQTYLSQHHFLGSAVGPHCKIGAGMIFRPGRTIPAHTTFLNHQMIDRVPQDTTKAYYLVNSGKLISLPEEFVMSARHE